MVILRPERAGQLGRAVAQRQIFDKTSMIARLVNITLDLNEVLEGELSGLDALVKSEVFKDCNYYEQSCHSLLLCGSGEKDGTPLVKGACNRCIVGQFSVSGVFVGELSINPECETKTEDSNIF
jgi:hypothetical protein